MERPTYMPPSPVNTQAATACATTCQERNCGSSGQRYGKYCGIGHTGCSGEAPCDAVDACCREHDLCVSGLAVIL